MKTLTNVTEIVRKILELPRDRLTGKLATSVQTALSEQGFTVRLALVEGALEFLEIKGACISGKIYTVLPDRASEISFDANPSPGKFVGDWE